MFGDSEKLYASVHESFAGTSKIKSSNQQSQIIELEDLVHRQHLMLQTLLLLLMEKKVIEEDEFKQWLEYVDGLDGRADGKASPKHEARQCPACGRMSSPNSVKCTYCSTPLERDFIIRRPQ